MPQSPDDRALSLLLSERVCFPDTLDALSADFMGSEHQRLVRSAAHHFAEATRATGILQLPRAEYLVPGALLSAVDETEHVAVLFELITDSDDVARKPAVAEFTAALHGRLLASEKRPGESEPPAYDLQRRFGSKVEIGRIERLSVGRGATAVAQLSTLRIADEPRIRRTSTVLAVSAVGVEAADEPAERQTLVDFAGALADDLLMMDCESQRTPGETRMNVRELLLVRRFGGDASLSARQAAQLVSEMLGTEVTIAKAARLLRREFQDSDPETFPGEQALRA